MKEASYRSLTVATIDINDSISVNDLVPCLQELGIARDIKAYRKLNRNQLRISFFPSILKSDLEKLIKALDMALDFYHQKS